MYTSRRISRFWTVLFSLLVLLAAAWAAWQGFRYLHPAIFAIPAIFPGETVVLQGRSFGAAGQLYVTPPGAAGPQTVDVESWGPGEIRVHLPEAASGTTFQVEKQILGLSLRSQTVSLVVKRPELDDPDLAFQVPVQPEAAWPLFRYDQRNTGSSPQPAVYAGGEPWMFQTGKGIFSTPIVDGEGNIYIGSADHNFYALTPGGKEAWHYTSGEMIDSAAILPAAYLESDRKTVIFPSGDGYLYCLDLEAPAASQRLVWKFDARVSPRASYNNWFEGNVAVGYDGMLYAGNTNFNYYALTPAGELSWTYPTASNNWSIAAIAPDGTIYWGSNDTFIRAVDPAGVEKWTTRTLGFIAASAAIGSDGTLYIGSFDSYLYALDPLSGAVKWKFKTHDHIYASVALGAAADGTTNAIYFGSTDGIFYALDPAGKQLWAYDTGDPIRSSPVLGASPQGKRDAIVYFGAGNGKLYALDTAGGSRRWSFDTTAWEDPILVDRNDLNASPALAPDGVVIAGEAGQVWKIPYDYCLNASDPRCSTQAAADLPEEMSGLYYVSPGGSVELDDPAGLPASTLVTLKLILRQQGATLDAHLCNTPFLCGEDALSISVSPDFEYESEVSADGAYLYIRPLDFLDPDTEYTLQVDGQIYVGGLSIGNLTVGGRHSGEFSKTFAFRTNALETDFPLVVQDGQVSALEWTRLAVPIPSMMPSLNQIGFDYMDWIMAPVLLTPPDEDGAGRLVMWVIGGKQDAQGNLVPDPDSDFTLAFNGRYRGNAYILENRDVTIPVTGIPIPFNFLEMRGQLDQEGRAAPGTTIYGDSQVMQIPTFGPYLVIAGLANNVYEKLLVSGTYILRPYVSPAGATPGTGAPPVPGVNTPPPGVAVTGVTFQAPTRDAEGRVFAQIQLSPGAHYPAAIHRPGIVLVDADSSEAVFMDYLANLQASADPSGDLTAVTLTLPAGMALPERLDAYVLLDVYPAYHAQLQGE
ncbi:MAG: PQQ-binding-like beta-propeller repeat protein [Anaerolineaceae bacterium]|nr:PQQ-binding-like beta-propeller repeat protein [Anaerolineaceae bacterium]